MSMFKLEHARNIVETTLCVRRGFGDEFLPGTANRAVQAMTAAKSWDDAVDAVEAIILSSRIGDVLSDPCDTWDPYFIRLSA